MTDMVPQWIIERKRDGKALSDEEIRFFVEGYASGSVPDYQMAALAMAIYFRGLTMPEILEFIQGEIVSGQMQQGIKKR